MKKDLIYILFAMLTLGASACKSTKAKKEQSSIQVVASSEKQWTGVAISNEDRLFVNFPHWSDDVPVSVAEIVDGKVKAYPNEDWNNPENPESFSAVQSVVIDKKNRLWVLDTCNPLFKGVQQGGPILYQFNLASNTMEKQYQFADGVYQPNSYFNDVRVDTEKEIAYMTDSGNGAIIVLDLKTGASKRLLDHHPSTESETDHLMCDGIKWENSVHSDGIALSPDKDYLYYIALTGHTLYRINTEALLNDELSADELAAKVEKVKTIPATDGIMFDKEGNLYLGGLEDNSINMLKPDGTIVKPVKDDIIRWADSFAISQQGDVYFTTSQIHLPPEKRKTYDVIRLKK